MTYSPNLSRYGWLIAAPVAGAAAAWRRLPTTTTALAALGAALTVAPSAQAVPPSPACTQYAFIGEYSIRGYPNSGETTWIPWTVTFTSNGTVAGGPAVVAFDDGGRVQGTVADGKIAGRK